MHRILHYSDLQLIEFICTNNRKEGEAIQYILDKNRKKITSYILKNSGDDADADATLVEGVTHLVFNIRKKKFRGESQLSTYLFSICRGVWLKELKKRKRFIDKEIDDEYNSELIDELTPFDHFNDQELKEEVSFLLNRLGNACKMVLELWAKHFSMTEISTQLGYKNSQIAMNKKNRCLGKLKEILGNNTTLSDSMKSYLN